MGKKLPEITILRDSREKQGWWFDEEEKKPGKVRVLGTVESCLNAGDYSIVGLEDKIRIERKNGFGELFGNYWPKDNQERFIRECEKLVDIPHKYLLVETSLNYDTFGLSVPQMIKGPPVKRVVDWILQISLNYGIQPIFVGDSGQYIAKSLFCQVARMYKYI
jgi:hypothetical protein